MKKIIVITLCAFFLISASVVEIQTMIIQPKKPISVKIVTGYANRYDARDVENALNTYTRLGYIVKTSSYNNNGNYLIILEKY